MAPASAQSDQVNRVVSKLGLAATSKKASLTRRVPTMHRAEEVPVGGTLAAWLDTPLMEGLQTTLTCALLRVLGPASERSGIELDEQLPELCELITAEP
jgi:hypothetical protein